jgi:heme A synthase
MGTIAQIHSIFGERVLPLLIVLAAVWFTVTWKPNTPRSLPARIFPILVDIQVTLGIIYWIYLLVSAPETAPARYLSFPFILHPILGILASVIAHAAVGKRRPFASLGRWAPLASLGLLLVVVIGGVYVTTALV